MTSLGIIPAGGQANRFGGTMKELLPCGDYSLLERAVFAMSQVCDDVLVISSPEKVGAHAKVLRATRAIYSMARVSLWESIKDANAMMYEMYYFAMPDTYFPLMAMKQPIRDDFNLWLFETDQPERFGVVKDDYIFDKQIFKGTHKAWGLLSWSWAVVDYWRDNHYANHTEAFNAALKTFGHSTFDLAYYFDCASFGDYRKLVQNV